VNLEEFSASERLKETPYLAATIAIAGRVLNLKAI
jgi:hypothetical protein